MKVTTATPYRGTNALGQPVLNLVLTAPNGKQKLIVSGESTIKWIEENSKDDEKQQGPNNKGGKQS